MTKSCTLTRRMVEKTIYLLACLRLWGARLMPKKPSPQDWRELVVRIARVVADYWTGRYLTELQAELMQNAKVQEREVRLNEGVSDNLLTVKYKNCKA